MSNVEIIKEITNTIRVLAEFIHYTKLGDDLSYDEHSTLDNIIYNMICLVKEIDENEWN